ncbi:HD domain-containing protein [Dactylosporangium vinaceum]|uniref:HD domain-containing protein n=1 Tax=Dactylosporangium vinaceum TaxID=53362 RepID=A0ABV5M3C5_9ACTN|nr:HD domain-containing protein [Dactylosporangium vinaceum]UAB99729.1 HD domain-containing protein [Dactylosporangium vinaceum]
MTDVLALPSGLLPDAILSITRTSESPPIAEHSIRSFLYARIRAVHEGTVADAQYREDLLFAACVLHDLGLGSLARGRTRFEVEGADLAAALLTEHAVPAADVDQVWEAIALHSSHGIADRRGLLTYLTYKGVFMDAGRFTDGLDDGLLRQVRVAYPRPVGDRSVRDAIADHAARSEAAAPPYSIGAELLRQRRAEANAAN